MDTVGRLLSNLCLLDLIGCIISIRSNYLREREQATVHDSQLRLGLLRRRGCLDEDVSEVGLICN